MKLPVVNGKEAVAALRRGGFVLDHVRGSHHYLRGPGGSTATVPVHGTETLKPGTLRSILRQAGMSVDEFVALL